MSDGELWMLIRNAIAMGGAIEKDYANRPYEQYAARVDAVAREYADKVRKLMLPTATTPADRDRAARLAGLEG